MSENWTEDEVASYLKRFATAGRKAQAAVDAILSAPNLEPDPIHAPQGPALREAVHPRYRIHVHCKRRRRVDTDGISAKAAIDGLVRGGILGEDSPEWVEAITFSQEKNEIEETIIELWEITR